MHTTGYRIDTMFDAMVDRHESDDALYRVDAYDVLDELYDTWITSVQDDVPWYRSRLPSRPCDIIELGAGSGRVTKALAGPANNVVAIEQSRMLAARLRAEHGDLPLAVIEADFVHAIHTMPKRSADVVVAAFRTLLHVPPAERASLLRGIRAALRSDGVFLFDLAHPSADDIADFDGHWFERDSLMVDGVRWTFAERATYAPDGSMLDLTVRCSPDNPAHTQRTATMRLYLADAHAWRDQLEAADLRVEALFGDFAGAPFVAGVSTDSVWVVRAAGAGH